MVSEWEQAVGNLKSLRDIVEQLRLARRIRLAAVRMAVHGSHGIGRTDGRNVLTHLLQAIPQQLDMLASLLQVLLQPLSAAPDRS